jgi:hypothetical protein
MKPAKEALFSAIVLGCLAVLFYPVIAVAQAVQDAPDLITMLQQTFGVVSTWKAAGWLGGMVALTNLLTNVTKIPSVEKFLEIKFWMRPLVSIILAVIGSVLASMLGGIPVLMSLAGGLIAGLSSGGFHELVTVFNSRVQAERGIGGKIVQVMQAADGHAEALQTAATQLTEIAKLPDNKAKLDALLKWAEGNA